MVGILEQPITILRTNARLFPFAANRSVVSNDCKLAERKVTLSRHYSSCKGSTLLSHPINSTLASSDLSNWPFWISTAAHLQIPTGSNFPLTNFSSCVCESNCQGGFLARSGYTTNISELGTAGRKRGKRSHISEISSIRWLSFNDNGMFQAGNDECWVGKVIGIGSQTPGPECWIWHFPIQLQLALSLLFAQDKIQCNGSTQLAFQPHLPTENVC